MNFQAVSRADGPALRACTRPEAHGTVRRKYILTAFGRILGGPLSVLCLTALFLLLVGNALYAIQSACISHRTYWVIRNTAVNNFNTNSRNLMRCTIYSKIPKANECPRQKYAFRLMAYVRG